MEAETDLVFRKLQEQQQRAEKGAGASNEEISVDGVLEGESNGKHPEARSSLELTWKPYRQWRLIRCREGPAPSLSQNKMKCSISSRVDGFPFSRGKTKFVKVHKMDSPASASECSEVALARGDAGQSMLRLP